MNNKKNFTQKEHLQYDSAIKTILVVFLGAMLFVCGYLASTKLLTRQISADEYNRYEQIAYSVYEQGDVAIYEVPDGVTLEKSDTSITISSAKKTECGKVVASVQNGKLVFAHDKEEGRTIAVGMLAGILFVLIWVLIWTVYHWNNEKRSSYK